VQEEVSALETEPTSAEEAVLGVTIPDYTLEVALRNALNKPEGPIYKSGLESLTSLNLVDNNINDISALSGLSKPVEVWLDGNLWSLEVIHVRIPQLKARGVFVTR
jgi:Leucine-rich repeat (LRR) protein